MSRKRQIFKDVGIYTVSSYISQAIDVINGILIRSFLGPSNMGIWSFLQVVQSYAKHTGLGITTATSRDIPYYLGKGEIQKAHRVKDVVFTFTFLASLIFALGVLIYAVLKWKSHSMTITIGLCVVAILAVCQRGYNFFITLIRAHKEFNTAGLFNILSSVTTLFFTILLVWRFKLLGLYGAVVLQYFAMFAFILTMTKHRTWFRFNSEELKPLLNLGSSMFIFGLLRTVYVSLDRIFVVKFLGFEALGHYSIATMAAAYLYALPNMLGIIFFPHLQEVYAQRDNALDLDKYLKIPSIVVSHLFPIVMMFVWIGAEILVPLLLPQYLPGMAALKFVIIGSFFIALSHAFVNHIVTLRRHWYLIPTQIAGIAALLISMFVLLHIRLDIVSVAAGLMLGWIFYLLSLIILSLRHVWSYKSIFLFLARIFLPVIIFCAFFAAREFIFTGIVNFYLNACVSATLFIIFWIPFIRKADNESGFLQTIKDIISKRRGHEK